MNAVAKSLGSQARGKWHEAKPRMIALHLRKSTGAMSIRPHLPSMQLVWLKVVMLQVSIQSTNMPPGR